MSLARLTDRVSYRRLFPGKQPFYQRYPYSGHVSARSVDSRGCIDLDLGFFCNRIPKAANSTVVASLAGLKLQREVGSKEAKRLFKRPSALSTTELDRLDSLFKFAVVRNPFSRTLSAYLDKVQRKQELGTWRGKHHDFHSFLRWLEQGALHSNAHWAPQTSLLLLPQEQFDFFGKVESLDQDLDTILSQIRRGSADTAPPARMHAVMSNATGARDKLERYYTGATRDLVLKLYAEDFEGLGYRLDFE